MKVLADTFRKDQYTWDQITREGDLAIYRQHKPGVERFNAIIIQKHDGRSIADKYFQPAEFIPSAEQWGRLGWTFYSLKKAEEKIAELKVESAARLAEGQK